MRLHHLFESDHLNTIIFEFGDTRLTAQLVSLDQDSMTVVVEDQNPESQEIINEVIPLAIAAVGAGISAYDAYRAYQDYRSGNIDRSQLAQRVGTNLATGLATGGIGKIASAGFRGARAAAQGIRNRIGRRNAPDAPETPSTPTPAAPAQRTGGNPPARPQQNRPQQARPQRTRPTRMSRMARRARRGLDGLGGGADLGDYSNPLQRAVQKVASFESAEFFEFPMIPGVELDRITESGNRVWIYKVW